MQTVHGTHSRVLLWTQKPLDLQRQHMLSSNLFRFAVQTMLAGLGFGLLTTDRQALTRKEGDCYGDNNQRLRQLLRLQSLELIRKLSERALIKLHSKLETQTANILVQNSIRQNHHIWTFLYNLHTKPTQAYCNHVTWASCEILTSQW